METKKKKKDYLKKKKKGFRSKERKINNLIFKS